MDLNLNDIFNDFNKHSIITLGDIMLDKYIWGDVERISPEAPVPVVHTQDIEHRIGGAGNVAANLSSLNCNSKIVSVTGDDSQSSLLEQLLANQDISPIFIQDPDRPTTIKSRVVSQQQQLIRIDHENISTVSQNILDQAIQKIKNIGDVDALILSDYDKGFLTKTLIDQLSHMFESLPIITDPKVKNWEKYSGSTIIKPNYKEFCQAIGKNDLPLDELETYASDLAAKFNLEAIIVTLGKQGVFYYTPDYADILPTEAHEVYDVSGAGDTFTAAFTARLLTTSDIKKAAQIGNLAAAVAVEKVGTATVSTQEIIKKSKQISK